MRALGASLLSLALGAAQPLTVPERTKYQRTSTVAEVRAFMDGLGIPRYQPKGAPRATEAGAPLLAWRLPATGPHPSRVYLNANIHAGEVEGKEAVQEIARELVQGKHPALRRHLEFVFMPCYNAEGTDALDPELRKHQPNPASGVGRRETARGLDLNRDAMKAQATNTRWFLAMLRDFDPDAVFDLHTTNGSYHGFHLTYAPPLNPSTPQEVLATSREMLSKVRQRLEKEGMPTYDYGNFEPADSPQRWETYDWLPRYLINYVGLTGRIGVLSEAYVYRSFPDRISDTRRFVLACLDWIAANPYSIKSIRNYLLGGDIFSTGAELSQTEAREFEVVDPIKDADGKVVGEKSRHKVTLPAMTGFMPQFGPSPMSGAAGYLIDAAYASRVKPLLRAHGIPFLPGTKRPRNLQISYFVETMRKVAKEPFQGVFGLNLYGYWSNLQHRHPLQQEWTSADMDKAIFVPLNWHARKRDGNRHITFYLLDPQSPDGLVHWGFFSESLMRKDGSWGEPPKFPILAIGSMILYEDPTMTDLKSFALPE